MTFRIHAKLSETSGQSVVELALVLPVLLLLVLGVYDYSRAILANNTIINMSREGANLASRTSQGPQDIMNSLAFTSQPLAMNTNGKMYITDVKKVGTALVIQKSEPWGHNRSGGTASLVDQAYVNKLLNMAAEGQTIHIFEVFYDYECLFMPNIPTLHSTTIF